MHGKHVGHDPHVKPDYHERPRGNRERRAGDRSDAPRRVALLYLDVDGFARINDALGHRAGDVFLRRLGNALRGATRQQDLLARVGGDEFVLLTTDAGDDAQLRELATRLMTRTAQAADAEYGGRFVLSASVGIATWPERATSMNQLLDAADVALHAAKRDGVGVWRFADPPARPRSNVVPLQR